MHDASTPSRLAVRRRGLQVRDHLLDPAMCDDIGRLSYAEWDAIIGRLVHELFSADSDALFLTELPLDEPPRAKESVDLQSACGRCEGPSSAQGRGQGGAAEEPDWAALYADVYDDGMLTSGTDELTGAELRAELEDALDHGEGGRGCAAWAPCLACAWGGRSMGHVAGSVAWVPHGGYGLPMSHRLQSGMQVCCLA